MVDKVQEIDSEDRGSPPVLSILEANHVSEHWKAVRQNKASKHP